MIKTSTLFLFISIFLNVHWHLRVFMNQQKLKRNKYPPYHILQFYSWQHMLLFLPKIITDLVFGHSIITHIWSPPLHWCGLCTTTVMWRINDCAWNIHLFRWVSNTSMHRKIWNEMARRATTHRFIIHQIAQLLTSFV